MAYDCMGIELLHIDNKNNGSIVCRDWKHINGWCWKQYLRIHIAQWIMWPRSINCVNDPMPCCECVHRTLIYSAILACNFNWIDHKSPQARLSSELNSQWTCSEWRSDEKTMYKPPNQIISSAFDAFCMQSALTASEWMSEWGKETGGA